MRKLMQITSMKPSVPAILLLALFIIFVSPAAAMTFTVNSASDNDDGTCDTNHCSLREALNTANANPGLERRTQPFYD